jgi:CubicO group peptidase (beta-lactamase class C family)
MRKTALIISILLCAGVGLTAAPSLPQSQAPAPLAAQLDQLLSSVYKSGEPGAALLIMKDGQVLVRKAYGMADLELGVSLEPDMVFRIGSMTKQFTAVAILMLMEQGKLALADPITKFLPDYPTQGKTITVEHLLTHTSGIQSYTDMASWLPLMRKDLSLTELINLFKDQPMQFAPGERWRYNNSGFILLGAIIEKVTGTTYETFVKKNIFDPLGLKHTTYGSVTRVIPRRIPGYGPGANNTFLNAEYISMTQPYAAGSLLSSVDDLAAWNMALLSGKLIKRETLERAWTPYKLNDGTSTRYGFGWAVGAYEGHRTIEHGGGIPGFTSSGILFPEDRLCVIMLTNSTVPGRAPGPFAFKVAALALARPIQEPKPVAVPAADIASLAGIYANQWNEELNVRVTGTTVTVSGPDMSPTAVFPLSANLFFVKDSRTRVEFIRDAMGVPVEVKTGGGLGPDLRYVRTAKALPVARQAIALDPKIFDKYAGEYELMPGFTIKFFRDGAKFMTLASGQGPAEIFAESETKFFLKVVDGQVEFKMDASGAVTGMVLTQNGRELPAKKIK